MIDTQFENVLADNYRQVQENIQKACESAGRNIDSVRLLAVSKFHHASQVASLALLGHRDFAENYLKEAKEKRKELLDLLPAEIYSALKWHSIGHIQTNKAKELCDNYALLHTVDSERLLQALEKAFEKKTFQVEKELEKEEKDTLKNSHSMSLAQSLHKQKILIEVNIGNEGQKAGVAKEDTARLIEKVLVSSSVELDGFMCLPPWQTREGENRRFFKELYELKCSMEDLFKMPFRELSMGTSADYREAILEGATMVRIGTDIFGQRKY